MEHKLIIFTDIGDTIIDEGSEVRKVPFGVVQSADCIPGAKETMLRLYEEGYRIVMVADGLTESFRRTMCQNGLDKIFSARSISEENGQEKPAPIMFQKAMDLMNLTDADKDRIIMVGNNTKRDILGANRFGIRSVLMSWSKRYDMVPHSEEETPDYTISCPEELLPLVEKLDARLS